MKSLFSNKKESNYSWRNRCCVPPTLPNLLLCLNDRVCIHPIHLPRRRLRSGLLFLRNNEATSGLGNKKRSRQYKCSSVFDSFPLTPPHFSSFPPSLPKTHVPFPSFFSLLSHSSPLSMPLLLLLSIKANMGSCMLGREAGVKGAVEILRHPSWMMGRRNHLEASGKGNSHGTMFDSVEREGRGQ